MLQLLQINGCNMKRHHKIEKHNVIIIDVRIEGFMIFIVQNMFKFECLYGGAYRKSLHTIVRLMLGHRLRRWPKIKQTVSQLLMFNMTAIYRSVCTATWLPSNHKRSAQRWFTVGQPSTTLAQQLPWARLAG